MRKWWFVIVLALSACGAQTTTSVAPTSAPTPVSVSVPTTTPFAVNPASPTSGAVTAATSLPTATANLVSESTNANGERVLGNPNAPITLADYSDFL